jgi:hypothetical protein
VLLGVLEKNAGLLVLEGKWVVPGELGRVACFLCLLVGAAEFMFEFSSEPRHNSFYRSPVITNALSQVDASVRIFERMTNPQQATVGSQVVMLENNSDISP